MERRTIKTSRPLIDPEIELNIINMNFVSFQEFEEWKSIEEVSCSSRFVKKRGTRFNKDKTVATSVYYCHRSGKAG